MRESKKKDLQYRIRMISEFAVKREGVKKDSKKGRKFIFLSKKREKKRKKRKKKKKEKREKENK